VSGAVISTWFVADTAETATFFPQVGSRSDAPSAQAVYWRCTACFFASSLAINPHARHRFYTNAALPSVDGVDFEALFDRWGVEVVTLPITYRLPKGSVGSWGNQFYIFDVLDHIASERGDAAHVVLDSDCLWLAPVDAMLADIAREGALTYLLDGSEHAEDEPINGLTRQGMARFLAANGGPQLPATPYYGGEIFAARSDTIGKLAARARALWPQVCEQGSAAPREEAHFLSVLYALEGIAPATANRYIRRMWTTFRHNNLRRSDADLTIWHLPVEKRTGFADLFARIMRDPALHPARDGAAMGLDRQTYARLMGWPRRSLRKFLRDLCMKLCEKLRPAK
jgi:hypothetical protein